MATYNSPQLHHGQLNTTFNAQDYEYSSSTLSTTTADNRYLKLAGGTITGSLAVSGNLNATTQTSGNSSTLVATTSFVGTAVSNLNTTLSANITTCNNNNTLQNQIIFYEILSV